MNYMEYCFKEALNNFFPDKQRAVFQLNPPCNKSFVLIYIKIQQI